MQILRYDGTFDGFLGVLERLYALNDDVLKKGVDVVNERVFPEKKNLLFGEKIAADPKTAWQFYKYLRSIAPRVIFEKLYLYYLCDTACLEIPLALVLKRSRTYPELWKNITDCDVLRLHKAERGLHREKHRWLGLLRFVDLGQGVLLARFEPTYNVLPLIRTHFVKRFPNETFFIVDTLRNLLFAHQRGREELLWVNNLRITTPVGSDPLVSLWKTYFAEVAIPERCNVVRQRRKLPLRFRQFLPEFWR
ncbi:MAG: TIGR03915 family putative DNA repair protein [Candidatus Caldatribacterium sp.]|uniref:TIGR03915 family putative DNA repair protein n=1 Tax=Candidatus Caldatribacterium sp. TaxID=2282143 RepID=UPI00299368D4|nr:TIGR03915 family putative DNA repair protein [Candidatus Caldatribacterium sp.]MCX7729965.1 TIGR03915 family putative DNA repair protein [Candidatus Caldatribacterium sp.]MDW8080284.1 TIGR03915 family putative DNA repair protein [Candidatus Calescibacterium sp.]